MNKLLISACAAAALAIPTVATAQSTGNSPSSNSAKEYAPGQQNDPANKSAPGQVKKSGDSAKEYAPGQQSRDDASKAGSSGSNSNMGSSTGNSSGSSGSSSGGSAAGSQ